MLWMLTESKDIQRSRSMKYHVGEQLLIDFVTGTLVEPLYEDQYGKGIFD